MRVAFAGTPEFAAAVLRGLLEAGYEVGLIISQPDAPRGRGRRKTPPPVATLAREEGLPLLQPQDISRVAGEILRHDVLVVAAYGQILRPDTLYAARHGAYNVHASLLPAYRGAAPVERAIMNGEKETGVTIIRMDEGLDTGPIALQRCIPIPPEMTGGELAGALARLGAEAMVEVLKRLQDGTLNLTEQDSERATYAPRITPGDQEIDWSRSAREVHDRVRALSPHIGARARHPEVEGPIKIWRTRVHREGGSPLGVGEIRAEEGRIFVGCGEGVVEVLELQLPGGRRLGAGEFLRGHRLGGALRG
ncbi:Methionyl-tRNA formyltransferase [Rubrobacter xylanophilus DSM 9941]|uniref:methionyl-tRNA formyltransferase n=1 Tax=Rubrobacter xylanophilus TaxID=49319 RepID=UPI001C63C755|nr:methionyl-tRNA formyltransferase [Rubrobacter xylanophilus]QYJ14702.1 Methionyl-tRNA formyltransferase [Rubrobacter xylanophilus DSM 9941]